MHRSSALCTRRGGPSVHLKSLAKPKWQEQITGLTARTGYQKSIARLTYIKESGQGNVMHKQLPNRWIPNGLTVQNRARSSQISGAPRIGLVQNEVARSAKRILKYSSDLA